jgi:hypothetical protein
MRYVSSLIFFYLLTSAVSFAQEGSDALPPGVVAVPASVRDNLGITFSPVERRVVEGVLRLPGRFESTPLARAEYCSVSDGRVSFRVEQYQRIEVGTLLYTIESEAWQEVLGKMSAALLAGELIAAQEAAAAGAVAAAASGVEVWRARVVRLRELAASGAGQAAQLAEASSALSLAEGAHADALSRQKLLRLEALAVRDAKGRNQRFEIALHQAATLVGCEEEWLLEEVNGEPRWRTLHTIDVLARHAGIVEVIGVPEGGVVEPGELVLSTHDPSEVRLRAFAPQDDLARLSSITMGRIVSGLSAPETLVASVSFATEADPHTRTFDLVATPPEGSLPPWARPGVAAFLEVAPDASGEEEFAIPLAAVQRDGLDDVFFLRSRSNPDQVQRVVGDLGPNDGRWIVVHSGVRPGDEVVVSGAFELRLATAGVQQQKGGHFHSDGTFHEGEH